MLLHDGAPVTQHVCVTCRQHQGVRDPWHFEGDVGVAVARPGVDAGEALVLNSFGRRPSGDLRVCRFE
jgi:hypothetical protein